MRDTGDVRSLSDDELIERFQEAKTVGTGGDPRLAPPEDDGGDALELELERRGLAPDREDLIPTTDADEEGEPVVKNQA